MPVAFELPPSDRRVIHRTLTFLLGLPSGRRVTAKEWARGLIVQFRSPDLNAQIVQDDASAVETGAVASARVANS